VRRWGDQRGRRDGGLHRPHRRGRHGAGLGRMISVLGTPLPAGAAERIAAAKLVVGAARHLSTVDTTAETVVLGEVPAAVARLAAHDGPRRLVVAERLGTADERITETTPAEAVTARWHDPNVVLVLGPGPVAAAPSWVAGNPPGPAGWALPEAAFAHRDSMITKAEV